MTVEKFTPKSAKVEIRDKALVHLEKQLADNPAAIGIRFTVTKTGCSGYSYVSELVEVPTDDDLPVESNTDLTLFMTKKAMPMINGIVVDFTEETLGQKKLTYMNPNETGRCGCGISFSIDKSADEEEQ